MHLGNGAITPECAAVTLAVAGGGLGWAGRCLSRSGLKRDQVLTAGGITAAIFAAQMVNFPVWPLTSAHLVGGVLAAWVLGPPLGAISMAIALTIQALTMGDGGLAALGANLLNMSLLPAGLVALVRERKGDVLAGTVAAAAVLGAALLMLVEISLFRQTGEIPGFVHFGWRMIAIHCWIAVPEAILTVGTLRLLGGVTSVGPVKLDSLRKAICFGVAALLVMCLLPHASPWPDGYEAAAQSSGLGEVLLAAPDSARLTRPWTAVVGGWQLDIVAHTQRVLATEQLLGIVSTAWAALGAAGVARLFAQDASLKRTVRR